MMKTINYPIVAQQGATFLFEFRVVDDDAGVVINMTDWTARMSVRSNGYADQSDDVALSLVGDIEVSTGVVEFESPASTMAVLAPSRDDLRILGTEANAWPKYVYDVELETPAGVVYKPYRGTFEIYPEVTR